MERREFIKAVAAAATVYGIPAARSAETKESAAAAVPWYRRTYRWAQTNITEIDPTRYDIAWWRQHWKRT